MHCDIGVICDSANVDSLGKLNITGVFDQVNASTFPVVHPYCAAVFRIVLEKGEDMEFKFRLQLSDDTGAQILPPMEVKSNAKILKGAERMTHNVIVNIPNLKIPSPGSYKIDLYLGETLIKSVPFYAKKILPSE